MIELGTASHDEMALAFLRAELHSARYRESLLRHPNVSGFDPIQLLEHADLTDQAANAARTKLLFDGHRKGLFRDFPHDTVWIRARIGQGDFARLKYANFPLWGDLSLGTRRVWVCAKALEQGRHDQPLTNLIVVRAKSADRTDTPARTRKEIAAIAGSIKQGTKMEDLILVRGDADDLIVLEGHARATAYLLAQTTDPIDVLVGASPTMRQWAWY